MIEAIRQANTRLTEARNYQESAN